MGPLDRFAHFRSFPQFFAIELGGFVFSMSDRRDMTPVDIQRENTARDLIDLVVDNGMTIIEAVEEVGIARSTWYYWVKQGKVDHLLRQKQAEITARFPSTAGQDE